MIEFSCSECGKRYKVEDRMAGKRAKCKCGAVLQVPEQLASSEPELASDPPQPPPRPRSSTPPPSPASASTPAAAECPSCGAAMAAAAVLCVACGYDKRTGKRIAGL